MDRIPNEKLVVRIYAAYTQNILRIRGDTLVSSEFQFNNFGMKRLPRQRSICPMPASTSRFCKRSGESMGIKVRESFKIKRHAEILLR
jgi:hypothetical protein